MGFRYRKSIKIAPGVKLNLSKKSVGVSVGTKGARMSISSTGRVTRTLSIPGTGISHVTTENINKKGKAKQPSAKQGTPVSPALPPEQRYTKKQLKTFSILFMLLAIICFPVGLLTLMISLSTGCVAIGIGVIAFLMSKKYKQFAANKDDKKLI